MYVDVFMAGVKTDQKGEYLEFAKTATQVFLEFGATRCVENWADDVQPGKLTSFPEAVKLAEDETVLVAWMEFPDKATRDACMEKAFQDPRMEAMQHAPLNGAHLVMGGFETILDVSG